MIEPFQDPLVAGVKGAYLTEQSGLTARFVQTEYEFKYRRMSRFESIDFIDTYAAAFRRDIFLQLGGFDTSYPGASVEDQEFSFRMQKAGHRMLFIPEARVHHLHSTSPWIYLRKKFKIGYWKVRVVKEHPGKLIKDTHTPQILKLQITAVFLFLLGLALFPFYTWIFPVLFAVVFAASAVPEIFFIARNSPPSITISAPFFLLLRSVGLGSGILAGILGTTLKTKSGLDQ